MRRLAFLLISLSASCLVHDPASLASNTDAATCHHELDQDRGRLAGVSDPAKKAEANGHLKAAYTDETQSKYVDCISELKAAEALMQ